MSGNIDREKTLGLYAETQSIINKYKQILQTKAISEKHIKDNLKNCDFIQNHFNERRTRITFVGVMKSGKSTTINACTGVSVLPSRTLPMTSIATSICHDDKAPHPVMTIPPKLYEHILGVFAKLRSLYEKKDDKPEEVGKFLQALASANYQVKKTSETAEEIDQALYIINELVRVCGSLYVKQNLPNGDLLIEELVSLFETEDDFPKIRANFLTVTNVKGTGTLALIDTPGPDETKLSDSLIRINNTILRDSDAVCVVLNSQSAGNTGETEVLKMVHSYCDVGKVYFALNKVDDQNERETAKLKFKQNIQEFNDLLGNDTGLNISDKHIFSMSSLQYNYSMMFKQYNIANPRTEEIPPATTAQWRSLYQYIYGHRWERMLRGLELKELKQECEEAQTKSGMDEFLTEVIHSALRKAAYRSIDYVAQNVINNLAILRKHAANQTALLEDSSNSTVEKIKSRIESLGTVQTRVTKLQEEAAKKQEIAINVCAMEWSNGIATMKRHIENHIDGVKDVWHLPFIKRKQLRKYFGDGMIQGTDRDKVYKRIQGDLEDLQEYTLQVLRDKLEDFAGDTYIKIIRQLGDDFSITVAAVRAAVVEFKQMNLRLTVPKECKLDIEEVKFAFSNLPVPSSKTVEVEKEKRSMWYFFNLVPYKEKEQTTVFELDPEELRKNVKAQISRLFLNLNAKACTKIQETISSLFNHFFSGVNNGIQDLKHDLERASETLKKSQDEIQQTRKEAKDFASAVSTLEARAKNLRVKVEELK